MKMEFRSPVTRKFDWCVSGALALVAAAVYALTTAGYVYPGESAHLMSVWSGLDTAAFNQYPLFSFFARMFGGGNLIAPVSGVVAVAALYQLVAFFIRERIASDMLGDDEVKPFGAIGGVVAALVFMFTPCVWSAFTHLEPRGFDFLWALLALAWLVPMARGSRPFVWLAPLALGVMLGLGLADTPLFIWILPLGLVLTWRISRRRGASPYGPVALMIFVFLISFFVFAGCAVGDFDAFSEAQVRQLELYFGPEGWLFVIFFTTLPFLVSLFSSGRAFGSQSGWMQWLFHLAMTFVAILAVATPLAPSSLMEPYGILPVAAGGLAAFVCGYLAAYWWMQTVGALDPADAASESGSSVRTGRFVAAAAGGVFGLVLVISALLNVFSFERDRGAFADAIARKLIADLGERTWIVTDGVLDDHIRYAAKFGFREEKEVNLVCLQRDLDKEYTERLAGLVAAKGIGGAKNQELVLSLTLGVLPFVQDWFEADPEGVRKSVVIFGVPDLWYGAGIQAVPEFLFFGGDAGRKVDSAADWNLFKKLLEAPEGWGSYRLYQTKNPVDRMRFNLRRHLGFVANDRGFWLQDQGRDDEAFDCYERVLAEIDADNVSALFNEYEMSNAGYRRAAAKTRELTAKIGAIVEDKGRRYSLLPLGNYYGYVRNPAIFIRMGLAWARNGRPGEALNQVRRAIDFIPSEGRTEIMSMMAALYASENEQEKSRDIYLQLLEKDATSHDALVGLMRLELQAGNVEQAIAYLKRSVEVLGDDPRGVTERAMLQLLQGDLGGAKATLRQVTDANRDDLQAWSLLAAVIMQQIDASTDAKEKQALTKELKDEILPTMEKHAGGSGDYHVQTTRAFILMREDGQDKRREARDAFVAAEKDRPDIGATSDIVLGLDISLNDTEDAEREAREVLRRNRKAPLANYVMGSLALQRGQNAEAEAFLRRSADSPKPVTLALNDLAEVLRRTRNYQEAERYARKAVAADPGLYVAWETLGSVLLDAKGDLDEAEQCVRKACELSRAKDGREEDIRMLVSLARVQIARGETARGKGTLRKVQARIDELSDYERAEFEELRKSAR